LANPLREIVLGLKDNVGIATVIHIKRIARSM